MQEKSIKNFVVPAALALVAALLTVALAASSMAPATSTEPTAADVFQASRGGP